MKEIRSREAMPVLLMCYFVVENAKPECILILDGSNFEQTKKLCDRLNLPVSCNFLNLFIDAFSTT
jgi:hypothetical protein